MTRDDVIVAISKAYIGEDAGWSEVQNAVIAGVALKKARRALDAIEAMGLRLVPVIPTEEMQRAVHACNMVPPNWERHSSRDVWRHMLNASPLKHVTVDAESTG